MIELSERTEFPVLAGMELGTDAGMVHAFGPERYHPGLLVLGRLRRLAGTDGAALVLAHPRRPFQGHRPPWAELGGWFEGSEVVNGDHPDSEHGTSFGQSRSWDSLDRGQRRSHVRSDWPSRHSFSEPRPATRGHSGTDQCGGDPRSRLPASDALHNHRRWPTSGRGHPRRPL